MPPGAGGAGPQVPGGDSITPGCDAGRVTQRTVRAETVRARLTALTTAGLPAEEFMRTASAVVRQAVPYQSACMATMDPTTRLMTGSVKTDLPDPRNAEFARHEYELGDVYTFRDLSARPSPVAVLADETGGHPERSHRWRDLLVPHFDAGHELRAVLTLDGAVWGALALYRPPGSAGFSPAEADFVAGLGPALARGIRLGLVATVAELTTDPTGPAVLVVGPSDEITQLSPAAAERMAELGDGPAGGLPVAIASIISSARRLACGEAGAVPRLRVRTPSGRWLIVHAAPLSRPGGGRGDVAVTIEKAGPSEVLPLVVCALGLTEREQQIVALLLDGETTARIGQRLHLSPYTVQDHFKSIFEKAAVRSRRELVARVFNDHYADRYGDAVGPSGWYATSAEQ